MINLIPLFLIIKCMQFRYKFLCIKSNSLIAIIILFLSVDSIASEQPPWTKLNTFKRDGNNLYLVCIGDGFSVDMARQEAINSCKSTATSQLASITKVTGLMVETDKEAKYHGQVETEMVIKGLICNPQNEFLQNNEDKYKVWIKCHFDLAKIEIVIDKESSKSNKSKPNFSELSKIRGTYTKQQSNAILEDKVNISIITIPQCDSIIIKGSRPRTINCNSNPIVISINSGDKELILRVNGYKPRNVDISNTKELPSEIQIIFD